MDRTGNLKFPAEGGAGPRFDLISISSWIDENQSRNGCYRHQNKPH
jgi:hypothetical protein